MILRDTAIAGSPRRHVIHSAIVSVLAMAAMLLGLFAVHSAGAVHEMDVAVPVASAHAGHLVAAGGVAGVGPVIAVATSASDGGWLGFGDGFMAGCGILAMACAVVLIVMALIRFARQPAMYARLLDAGGFVVGTFRTIPLPIHRPSLTVLSIRRV